MLVSKFTKGLKLNKEKIHPAKIRLKLNVSGISFIFKSINDIGTRLSKKKEKPKKGIHP